MRSWSRPTPSRTNPKARSQARNSADRSAAFVANVFFSISRSKRGLGCDTIDVGGKPTFPEVRNARAVLLNLGVESCYFFTVRCDLASKSGNRRLHLFSFLTLAFEHYNEHSQQKGNTRARNRHEPPISSISFNLHWFVSFSMS